MPYIAAQCFAEHDDQGATIDLAQNDRVCCMMLLDHGDPLWQLAVYQVAFNRAEKKVKSQIRWRAITQAGLN